MYKIFNTQI